MSEKNPKTVNIILDNGIIKWSKDTINQHDHIIIKTNNHSMSASQLYSTLNHPLSNFKELLEYNKNIRLYVCYWTLYDIRYKELDGDLENNDNIIMCTESNLGPDGDCTRRQPVNSLTVNETKDLLKLLQNVPELHVFIDTTNVYYWGYLLKSQYIGVLRSFSNITDIDHSRSDKYGWPILELTQYIYHIWNIKTNNIVRYHGSDDNIEGIIPEYDINYYHTGDLGFTKTNFSDLIKYINEPYRNLTESLYLHGFEIEAKPGTPSLKDMIHFHNLKSVRIEAEVKLYRKDSFIDIDEKKYAKYWVIDIPPMKWISEFELTLDISLEDNQDLNKLYLVHIRFGDTPNLHSIHSVFDYYTTKRIDNIHVRVTIPGNFDKIMTITDYKNEYNKY